MQGDIQPSGGLAAQTSLGPGVNETVKPDRAGAGAKPLPRVEARSLLGTSREIILVYKDMEYKLRLTNNDKLILTK